MTKLEVFETYDAICDNDLVDLDVAVLVNLFVDDSLVVFFVFCSARMLGCSSSSDLQLLIFRLLCWGRIFVVDAPFGDALLSV